MAYGTIFGLNPCEGIAMAVLKFSVPEIFLGQGSLKYAGVCARRLGAEKIFLVSDPGLESSGWVEKVFKILENSGLKWVYYSDISSNPRDYEIERGARLYQGHNCDGVMALGGGSPMDAAKGIALVAGNGGRVNDYEGANRIEHPLPPMVFIPSTASSGSDISQFTIITDPDRGVKMSIISRTLVPNVSIIDPVLLTTKSRELIIAAAVDALSHAVEAYVSPIASPLTEIHSLQAIKEIIRHLYRAVEGRSLDDLETLSQAGTSAAMAFSNAGLGLDHALAHSIGGMLDAVHGTIHSVLLPPVMAFNLSACPGKMAKIGKTILGKSTGDDRETALAGIQALEEFFCGLNIPTRLRQIIPHQSDLDKICKMALGDACLLSNPRSIRLEDMLCLCQGVW